MLSLAAPAAVGLGLGLQLSSLYGERVRREAGYPGLELLRSWGCTDSRLLSWPAEPRPRRRLHLPPGWPRRAREAPTLLVFVNGQRLPFLRNISVEEPSGVAYYERSPTRGLDLLVSCPNDSPCGVVEALPEDRGLEACVARARLLERPGAALLLTFSASAAALLAWLSLRGSTALLGGALAAAAFTSAWFAFRLYRGEWAGALLMLQFAPLGLPLLLRNAAARARPIRWLLDRGEARLAAWRVAALENAARWIAGLLAVALAAPLALTQNAYLGEWGLHFYNVVQQLTSLREGAYPSPFLHAAPYGAFYPWFAFYGGPLYAVTAGLGLVLSAAAAYKLTYVGAFALSYLGSTWWARLSRVPSVVTPAIGLLSISSAYWLSLAYGKGAWGELIASSALPFILAALTANARSVAPTRTERAALVAGWVVMSGSHTLTLIWGGLFASAYLLVLLLVQPGDRSRAAIRAVTGCTLGIGLNGWFLGPLLAYAPFTRVAEYSARGFGTNNQMLDSLAVIFRPWRHLPAGVDTLAFVQVSLYALLWALAACSLSWRRLERRERLALVTALLAGGLLLSLLTQGREGWFWRRAPDLLRAIQYPPRLHVYLSLCVQALVLLGIRSASRSPHRRLWSAGFVVALALQFGLAAYQVQTAPKSRPIRELIELARARTVPRDYQHDYDYRFATRRDGSGLGLEIDAPSRASLDLRTIHADHAEMGLTADMPGPFATNVSFSPLLAVRGDIVLLGRTREGLAVIGRRTPGAAEARGALQPAWPFARLAGAAITGLALLGCCSFLLRRNAP